jgi:hypothetical protein
MTNSHSHPKPPTDKQLSYLRSLAISRGETFVVPTSRSEASSETGRLKGRRRSSHADRAAERFGARQVADRWTPATDVRPEEIEGYGSTARWVG